MRAIPPAAGLFALVLSQPALAETQTEDLLRYGEQLAQECATCHRRDGKNEGIPAITTMSAADIESTLMLYKSGRRKNKVMVSVAASLNETQMKAIAAYLASLPKPPVQDPVPPKPRAMNRPPDREAEPAARQ